VPNINSNHSIKILQNNKNQQVIFRAMDQLMF